MNVNHYPAGTLVRARDRDWLVLPGAPHGLLLARPLGGRDEETTVLLPEFDDPRPAVFTAPTVDDRGDANRARLLRDALRLSFRATGGPFRSFANLSVTPRNYQLVPLMMSAAQDTTRLLIADGVGVGKTVEAGLIAAELLATGDAHRLAVLCSPQLAPQWQAELRNKFGIDAQLLLPSTVNRLKVPWGSTIYQHYPHLVISTDFIKQHTRRDEFALHCPELVIVDEAHTCVAPASAAGTTQAHLRYTAAAQDRRRPQPPPAAADRHPAQRRRRRLAQADRAARPPAGRTSSRPVRPRPRRRPKTAGPVHDSAPTRRHPRIPARGHTVPAAGIHRDRLPAHPGLPGAVRRRHGVRPRSRRRPEAEQRAPAGALVVGDRPAALPGLQPGRGRADPAQPVRSRRRRQHRRRRRVRRTPRPRHRSRRHPRGRRRRTRVRHHRSRRSHQQDAATPARTGRRRPPP